MSMTMTHITIKVHVDAPDLGYFLEPYMSKVCAVLALTINGCSTLERGHHIRHIRVNSSDSGLSDMDPKCMNMEVVPHWSP